jgi:hypothetical protein
VAGRSAIDPLEFLARRGDPQALLQFFKRLAELFSAAFADAAKAYPGDDAATVNTRGHARRLLLHKGMSSAAAAGGYLSSTHATLPPTWSFPVVRIGAFSLTVGIIDRTRRFASVRLRTRGAYARELASGNEVLNPQPDLLTEPPPVARIIPDGSLGGFLVAESSPSVPDSPLSLAFFVPSPDLRRDYFRIPFEQVIEWLGAKVAENKKPVRKRVQRKSPVVKKGGKRNGPE